MKSFASCAAQRLAHEKPGQTLQATALVHEAYLRLVDVDEVQHWQNRGHFFAAAAEAMRRILVDNARRHQAQKRGGGRERLHLRDVPEFAPETPVDLLALDEALKALEDQHPEKAQVVKLRFFAGRTLEETAAMLGISCNSPAKLGLRSSLALRSTAPELSRNPAFKKSGRRPEHVCRSNTHCEENGSACQRTSGAGPCQTRRAFLRGPSRSKRPRVGLPFSIRPARAITSSAGTSTSSSSITSKRGIPRRTGWSGFRSPWNKRLVNDPDTMIGPYKLLEPIGEGGMGTVYMAEQSEPIRRRVALKIIKPGMDKRPGHCPLRGQRQALALMDHPHIAKVLDAGTTGAAALLRHGAGQGRADHQVLR